MRPLLKSEVHVLSIKLATDLVSDVGSPGIRTSFPQGHLADFPASDSLTLNRRPHLHVNRTMAGKAISVPSF